MRLSISWKQIDFMAMQEANYSTKAEYVAAASCCGQVLWIQNQMLDYGYNFMNTKIFIDNESTICIVKNLVFHSKTKHIKIRHHFIRDSNEKKLIQMIKIHTDQNVADLLTKGFDRIMHTCCLKWKGIAANDEIHVSVVGLTFYYVLTMNPTIYTSCIKQLWATAKAKIVNGEVQVQALVDGKKVIITETSVRRALQLKDVEGVECLPNATIFEQLTLMGTMASAVICLATNQKFNFFKYIFDNMVKNLEGRVKFLMYPREEEKKKQPRRKQRKDTEVPQPSSSTEPITDEVANEEHVPTHSSDPLLSGEDRLKLNALMKLSINLSQRVLDLENTKTSQAAEITKLKEMVKKLERRNKSRTPGLKRLRKVGKFAQVFSSEDEGLGAQEDASKQGRKIVDLDADAEEIKVENVVSTAEVTTVNATTTTVDELTLAQTLKEIKAAKPKAVTSAATTTKTAVTRPKARGVAKDKGKAKMVEPEKPLKKKDQILIDEEIAQKLQAQLNAELEEEDKLAKQREEDANIAEWDNVQAMIDADYELAARLQAQEQEELISRRAEKKITNQSSEEKSNVYLSEENVMKGGKEKDEGSVTRAEESSSKRAGIELEQERIKKQKMDDDQEEAEMKRHMEIVDDEQEIAVDAIPLATKPPIIIDWKIIKEGKMGYFQIIRADSSSRRYSSMIMML
ncbi:hypothetical protein Tco_0829542 [Tanacetum coccineum]